MGANRNPGRRRRAGERGASTVETVIAAGAMFFLIFTGVQVTLWFHAANVALGAAEVGARAASAAHATTADGQLAASTYLANAGGDDVLRSAGISPARSAAEATVTVTGRPHSVIPGWSGPLVTRTASFPVERFTQ